MTSEPMSRPVRVSTARPGAAVGVEQTAGGEIRDGRGRAARPRHPRAAGSRARTPPRRAPSASVSEPASVSPPARRPARCSARACAPSTSAGRPCSRGPRSRSRGSRRRSSRRGCGGTPDRVAPSSRSRTSRTPRPRAGRRRSRTCRPGRRRRRRRHAGRDALAERRRGLDGQRVRADVVGFEREHVVERRAPVVERLPRRPVDEIDADPLEANASREVDRARDVGTVVRAAQRGEHVRAARLHAEREPVDSGPAVRRELGRVDRVGIALDRDLGARCARDRVEHPHEQLGFEERRRAAAEEHARRRRQRVDPRTALDVGDARVDVVDHEMRPVGPRREVAVVAAVRAERNVHVDAERIGHGVPRPCDQAEPSRRRRATGSTRRLRARLRP